MQRTAMITSKSVQDTENIGKALAKKLQGTEIVALYGGLGAGKTAFVRGLAKGLECKCDVTSPTFSLVHEYCGKIDLFHFDMYRVNSFEDLASTGFFDYLEKGVLAIEWSENIEAFLPSHVIKIFFERGRIETERLIKFFNE